MTREVPDGGRPAVPEAPRRRDVRIARDARLVLVLAALALLVPLAGMRLQGTAELERFHNRVLKPWPGVRAFAGRPAAYFAAVNAYLADRVFPIVAATDLKNALAYRLLDTSPSPNVTVSRDGLVFLNGPDAGSVDTLVAGACVTAADPAVVAGLAEAIRRIGAFARARNLPIDVVLVPTFPTLYGDRLPRSLPPRLREACAERAAGRSPLLGVASVAGTRFVYPFAALRAHAGDLAFFPNGNFHPDGLSVAVARDAYLAAIGTAPPADETVTLASAPSELLEDYGGFSASFPIERVAGAGAPLDDAATARIRAITAAGFFVDPTAAAPPFALVNAAAPDPRGILVLSDSFGINAAESLGTVFRRVTQMTEPDRDLSGFLDAVAAVTPFDRVVVLFNESNIARVARLAKTLPPAGSSS